MGDLYTTLTLPETSLLASQVICLFGLGIAARMRVARDPKIGRPIHVLFDSGGIKPVLYAVELGLLVSVLLADGFPKVFGAFSLFGALTLTWLSPGAHDRGCGAGGVFRGWYGRTWEELEEWRLTGDHLRFRLFGEWTSVDLPREKQAAVRAILTERIPERESAFKE